MVFPERANVADVSGRAFVFAVGRVFDDLIEPRSPFDYFSHVWNQRQINACGGKIAAQASEGGGRHDDVADPVGKPNEDAPVFGSGVNDSSPL